MNRKQRRAKQGTSPTSTSTSTPIKSADDIPLARPEEQGRERGAKTLLEIAAERQAQLATATGSGARGPGRQVGQVDPSAFRAENIVRVKIGEDGNIVQEDQDQDTGSAAAWPFLGTGSSSSSKRSQTSGGGSGSATEIPHSSESETPWLDTVLLSSTLSAVHFTLSVLAMHQYAETLRMAPLARQTLLTAFPTLTALVALFHGQLLPSGLVAWFAGEGRKRLRDYVLLMRSAVYVVTANVAGCYLIALTNDKGYYAVMKDAPGVGTIWVWAVLEMGLLGALAGVVGPGAYAWWYGYGVF